jgi:hypothetical protein
MTNRLLITQGGRFILLGALMAAMPLRAASTQPLVAIHDSELTRALVTMPATAGVPTGPGTTGFQWWPTNWNYYVMPDSLKEALSADGTAYTVVSDANITAGALLNAQGLPAYPIVISLAAEATTTAEAAALTSYVAAGGFLFVGSSAFTRNTSGGSLGNFAFSTQMGVSMVNPSLNNWTLNSTFSPQVTQQLISHIPGGTLTWQMPSAGDEISWQKQYHLTGVTPPGLPHMLWQVRALDAQVLAVGDTYPYILIKPYGSGYFIYDAAMQPMVGHGGWAPGMYAYCIFRNAIEWAFQTQSLPVPRISPWPYAYNAAVMFRHDGEGIPWCIETILGSIQAEVAAGAHGDYFFCTGALREDFGPSEYATTLASLQSAAALGATISSHNGGLTNINPVYNPPLPEVEKVFSQVGDWYTSLDPFVEGGNSPPLNDYDYDYWHWGPDEFLDLPKSVVPAGYSSATDYIVTSLANSFSDIAGWGLGSPSGKKFWVAPFFNATRDASYQIEQQLGIVAVGEQKLSPFPHWTLATQAPTKTFPNTLFPVLTLPVSDWYIDTAIAQSMEAGHNNTTVSELVDYYYNLGALINLYSHSSSAGDGLSGEVATFYLDYSLSKPLVWSANTESIYNWWLQRNTVSVTPSYAVNGSQSMVTLAVSGATSPNTAVEVLLPQANPSSLQVLLNGATAPSSSYRTIGSIVKVLVGTSVSSVEVIYSYSSSSPPVALNGAYATGENTPLVVSAPGVLAGATSSGGGTITAAVSTLPANGTLVLNADGSFTYTPGANFVGQDSFQYIAVSGGLDSLPATVTITVSASSQVLFSDNFPGTSLSPFILESGTWTVANGVMSGSSTAGNYGYAYYNNSTWTDYTVEATISFSIVNGPWGAGIGGRLNSTTGAHYGAWVYPEGSGGGSLTLKLIKFETWTTWSGQPMATATLTKVGTTPHTLALTFKGATISVSFDNTQVISVTDGAPYATGGITADVGTGSTPYTFNVSAVMVSGAGTAPVANNNSYSIAAGTLLSVTAPGVLANDTGGSGPLTAKLVNNVVHGTLTLNANGSFTYLNTGGYTGQDVFTYEATDGVNTSTPASVTITVTPLVANPDSYSMTEGGILTVGQPGVLGNDQGGGAGLTATKVTGPVDGSLTLNSNGSFTYTPNAGFSGSDSFTYTAGDAAGDVSAATTVTIAVNASQAPTANNDSYSVMEGGVLTVAAPGVLANDTGGVAPLTATKVTGPANGTLTFSSNGSFTYTPNAGFTGTDTFTYTATDGVTVSSPATVTITVNPSALFTDTFPGTSLAPFINESGTWSVANNVLSGTGTPGNYAYAYVPETWTDYSLQAQVQFPAGGFGGGIGGRLNQTTGAHYGVWIYPEGSSGGSAVMKLVKFTTWTAWSGTPLATANLTSVGTTTHTVSVTFQGANITVLYDGKQVISTTDSGAISGAAYTSGGITADLGTDQTPYAMNVSDVIVTAISTTPVANNDSYSVVEGTPLVVAAPGVLANDTGGNGPLTATKVTGPANGTLALNSDGSFTYTPNSGFTGTDTFTYTATDGQSVSSPATVSITVTPSSGVLFTDNFPGTTLSPFVNYSGAWSVANGVLSGSGTPQNYSYAYVNETWTDYSLQAQVQFPAGGFGGGIGGRLQANGAHYGVWIYPEGSAGGSAVMKLVKFTTWTAWSGTPLATANLTSVGTTTHTVLASFQGSTITVSYDGQQVISTTDTGSISGAPYTSGGITAELGTDETTYTMDVSGVLVQSLP